jgi:hypothetical protein
MTDTYEPDDGDQDEPTPRDLRQQLAQRAREADELRAQLESVKRDAEFTKALGGDADAPWVKYFRSGYDGDVNAEAIRKAAGEAGFLNVQQPPASRPSDDLAGHARMVAAASGADGTGTVSWQEAMAEADRIPNQEEREAAILNVVERFGGVTSRTAQ